MTPKEFIGRYRTAFGEKAGLPLVFWYSDAPFAEPDKLPVCCIEGFQEARKGKVLSLNKKSFKCPGALLYAGYAKPSPGLPGFISGVERYKQSEELVADYVGQYDHRRFEEKWMNVARIDMIESFDDAEGVVFYATPDMLAGLVGWCFFDTNAPDAVVAPFGSGCGVMTAEIVRENKTGGKRTFIGMFDPSARVHVEENIMTYCVPVGRFREMCETMDETFLLRPTKDWPKIRARIDNE